MTAAQPALRGGVVVLYATGLGPTLPAASPNQIPQAAAWIVDRADFRVAVSGADVDRGNIQYAGVTPGFAGLFQINPVLPANAPASPQIQIGYGSQLSPAGVILPLH